MSFFLIIIVSQYLHFKQNSYFYISTFWKAEKPYFTLLKVKGRLPLGSKHDRCMICSCIPFLSDLFFSLLFKKHMNGEIRTTKELTHQSRIELYQPTKLPWFTIKWSFSSYANNFNNLEAFVGQAVQGCKYYQAEILISIICRAYSVNIHKEFMNRNQEEITYFLSIVTISSLCWEG